MDFHEVKVDKQWSTKRIPLQCTVLPIQGSSKDSTLFLPAPNIQFNPHEFSAGTYSNTPKVPKDMPCESSKENDLGTYLHMRRLPMRKTTRRTPAPTAMTTMVIPSSLDLTGLAVGIPVEPGSGGTIGPVVLDSSSNVVVRDSSITAAVVDTRPLLLKDTVEGLSAIVHVVVVRVVVESVLSVRHNFGIPELREHRFALMLPMFDIRSGEHEQFGGLAKPFCICNFLPRNLWFSWRVRANMDSKSGKGGGHGNKNVDWASTPWNKKKGNFYITVIILYMVQ